MSSKTYNSNKSFIFRTQNFFKYTFRNIFIRGDRLKLGGLFYAEKLASIESISEFNKNDRFDSDTMSCPDRDIGFPFDV